ncbi:MAG: ATP-binding protein, partial [Bacteroidales bacterium]
ENKIMQLLLAIKEFSADSLFDLGEANLFSSNDRERKNNQAVDLLKKLVREISSAKDKTIGLSDTFELQFRIIENDNDSGWVEKLSNVGSEGTDVLVKAMINIMLLNVFKERASKRFSDFKLHCMMDEIGKLHPNNVRGILEFANQRNILLINGSPTSYNAVDYKYTYLLMKDAKNITVIKRLIKKGA